MSLTDDGKEKKVITRANFGKCKVNSGNQKTNWIQNREVFAGPEVKTKYKTTCHYSCIMPSCLDGNRERQTTTTTIYNESPSFPPSMKPKENFPVLAFVKKLNNF